MATVPSAALSIQQPDPLARIGEAVRLKSLMQQQSLFPGQQQAQQQQLASGGLALEQQRMQVEGTKAIMASMANHFGHGVTAAGDSDESAPGEQQPAGQTPATAVSQSNTTPRASGIDLASATLTPGGAGLAGFNAPAPAAKAAAAAATQPPSTSKYGPAPTAQVLSAASPSGGSTDFTNQMWNVYQDAMHSGKVLPSQLFELSKGIIEQQKQFADKTETEQKIAEKQLTNGRDLASQLLAEKDPNAQGRMWGQVQDYFRSDPNASKLYSQNLIKHVLSIPYPGEDQIGQYFTLLQGSAAALSDEKARLENAKAQQAVGPLPPDRVAQTNQEIGTLLSQIPNLSAATKATYTLPSNATQVDIDRVNDQLKALIGASPALAAAKAGAEARAKVPSEIAAGVGTEIGKLKAQQAMFPSPTVGVAPHLVGPATAAAQKAGVEYVAAQNAADEMQSFIDLARSGNKVAYAYAPTTGVLTINAGNQVKRVNMAEIQQYGGAGSFLDRVQGWAGKQVSGQSIPADVLNDMEQLHQQLAINSHDTYGKNLAVVNGVYGSQFQPVALPQNSAVQAPNANRPAAATPSAVKQTPKIAANPGEPTAILTNGHPAVVRNNKWVDTVTGQEQ